MAPDRPHVEINGRCMIFDNLAPSGLPPAHGRSAQEEVPANDRKPDGASPVLQWDRAPIKVSPLRQYYNSNGGVVGFLHGSQNTRVARRTNKCTGGLLHQYELVHAIFRCCSSD